MVFQTNSKLVISSWRNDEKGLMILMDKLKEYLGTFDYEVNFIILDDDFILGYEDRLIKTDIRVGLTKENVDKEKMLLKRLN